MYKTFGDLIRDLIEVYADDIIVKIKTQASLLDNLTVVFDRLRSTRTKLNPNKCVFRVKSSKLLGFLVSHRGIKANPEKMKTIEAMRCPIRIKDVQKLTRCLVVLSQFILDFKATNNTVEYEARIFGLITTLSLGVWQLLVKGDSQLIIKQVKG
jgi:ribonuclease HI